LDKLPEDMQETRRHMHQKYLNDPDSYVVIGGEPYNRDSPEGLSISSTAVSIYANYDVGDLPLPDKPAPVVVIFPEFRRLERNPLTLHRILLRQGSWRTRPG